jgi:hypothetical protein
MYLSNNNGRHKGGGEKVKKRRKRAVRLLTPRVGARVPIARLRLSAGPPTTGNNTMWTAWISTGMYRIAHMVDGERSICHYTQQPTTPHWKAPYWTRKSPFELRLKPDTDATALCSSVRVPHSDGTLYPTSQRLTNTLFTACVP